MAWAVALAALVGGISPAPADDSAGPAGGEAAAVVGSVLRGVALDARGRGLAGVEIRLAWIGGPESASIVRVRSDERGRFVLGSLTPGLYRLVAVKGGYAVFVGQVNTLLQDSLELILAPAGAPGPPGMRPQEASWALRLPRRDLLEDRDFATTSDLDAPAPAVATGGEDSRVFSVEALASRVDDSSGALPSGAGTSLSAGAAWMTAGRTLLSGGLTRLEEGVVSGLRENAHTARALWSPGSGLERWFSLQTDLYQRETSLGLSSTTGGADEFNVTGMHVAASRSRTRAEGVVNTRAELVLAQIEHQPGPTDGAAIENVTKMGLWVDGAWRWGKKQEASLGAAIREVNGAAEQFGDQVFVAQPPFEAPADTRSLGEAAGQSATVFVGDRWTTSPALELSAEARTLWTRGYETGPRTTTILSARWRPTAEVSVAASAGVVWGGVRSGDSVGAVGVEGDGQVWGWSVGREHEVGPVVWRERVGQVVPADLTLAGRDALVDRWTASLRWRSGGGGADVHLRGSYADAEGSAAPRVPGDIALTPVAGPAGSALGRRVELGVAVARSRTAVAVSWDELRDRAEAKVLLDGAERWRRRAILLRQRISVIGKDGPQCDLVLGAEDNQLDGSTAPPGRELRWAVLERRRVSGGLALSF
jgi:hypothetical protein